MKTILRYVMLTLTALMLTIPGLSSAEAKGILLLPVVNNAENTNPQVISQIYYQVAMDAIHDLPDYDTMDSDDIEELKALPTQEELVSLAKARRADIIVCFQLDVLDYTTETRRGDDYVKLDLEGWCVTYDAESGKYARHRILEDKVTEADVTNRWDWTGEEWGKSVRREMNRVMKNKRVQVYAPRMSSLK